MPLNGNTYVAPTWRNGQPPALDPTELQAISDSIVRNQTDNANQDSLIAALQTAVGSLQAGSAKIEVGSYVGTGTYGVSNPNSITCSFAPIFLIVNDSGGLRLSSGFTWNESFIWTKNSNFLYTTYNTSYATCNVTQTGNTLSWYSTSSFSGFPESNAQSQINTSGKTYTWFAIG